ncbi:MAG: bifunctional folylpolyglutamate synthase/dihydrofolate synthase, partial [Campylobacter sp.]|nr:bifunctional folylpolyglutamate synthase/dihydrofolate synthase [Campylobacter sp.]
AEFDATSQFNKKLSLFTPIGTDHIPMLGSNLEEISRTKLINMAKNAILNDEMNEVSVKIAKQIAEKNGANLKFANEFLSEFDKNEIQKYIEKQGYADFQISNLTLAYAGAKFFNKNINLANLEKLKMHGRLEKITPNLTIDVGHNELAAEAILKEFAGQKVVLIYNAFADKDIRAIFEILKPIVKRVEIFDYDSDERELGGEKITAILDEFKIPHTKFTNLQKDENYLVFGSFYLVENFLKFYKKGKF